MRLQLHRRAALALTVLALAVLAVPLGIQPVRAGRSWGALTGIGILVLYWGLLAIGEMTAESGWLPVAVAMWFPNLLIAGLAIALLRRTVRSDS